MTGEAVEYLPSQDPLVADRFPEIPPEAYLNSVQLIEPDGRVYTSAEAVMRSLAKAPNRAWMWKAYQRLPGAVFVSEFAYRFVAAHRTAFSALTWLGWGTNVEPASYFLTRLVFLRVLGLIYLMAFASLSVQMLGLVGSGGILPASETMSAVRAQCDQMGLGWDRYRLFPTLCWLGAGDAALQAQCGMGAVLAALLVAGVAPQLCLAGLWLLYLSLTTIGREFMAYQWDNLLLEVGLLSIFFAPRGLWPKQLAESDPPKIFLWLLRWLLFRLMFLSGVVKLTSGDPTWRNLDALSFHYETQPLPTWLGWHADQLPDWFHQSSAVMMFAIELAVPFLIFLPRRLRFLAALAFVALELLIAATGNYGFFNWLTILLCLLLLDDSMIQRWLPKKFVLKFPSRVVVPATAAFKFRLGLAAIFAAMVAVVTFIQISSAFRVQRQWPKPVASIYQWMSPLRSVNAYGLFSVMTTSRPEIIVEGSNDGVRWQAYEFRYKPGDVQHRPAFVAPHMPRLDWQMWFAALGDYRHNPWFLQFCHRLMDGAPEVLALLKHNPFPESPPRYLRAHMYDYQFADGKTRRETGSWWVRDSERLYFPGRIENPAQ